MGMPITVEIVDQSRTDVEKEEMLKKVFDYFTAVDARFSTYKNDSEISRINRGEIKESQYSAEAREVFALSEQTRQETHGYFNIRTPEGKYDPSGLVKGWAIYHAANIVWEAGYKQFYIDAGGDSEVVGTDEQGKPWSVGIRDPFSDNKSDIIKTVYVSDRGVATSGAYIRGQHIYNPHKGRVSLDEVASITVIGPNVYEADRFATAAFAMGREGIHFIEQMEGFEGYMVSRDGIATMTTGFEHHTRYI